jgi:hypothetical protein
MLNKKLIIHLQYSRIKKTALAVMPARLSKDSSEMIQAKSPSSGLAFLFCAYALCFAVPAQQAEP